MSLLTAPSPAPAASPAPPLGPAPKPTPPRVTTEAPPRRLVAPPPAPPITARVMHVVNGEHYSGAERVQDLLAQSLPQFGYEVGFASLKEGKFGDYRRSVDSPLYEMAMKNRLNIGVARRLARLVREEEYSILHAHTPRALMVSYLASRLARVPLVYHVHSPASRDSTRWFANRGNDLVERGCAGRADQVITVSPTLTNHMRSRGVSPDRLRCVLNGVPEIEDESVISRRRRPPIGPFVVGMVALFRPRKGTETLLEAIATLRSRGHDFRLMAIGPFETMEYEHHLYQKVQKLDLSEAVQWTGFTDDVPAALARIDALALPSLFGEGLPMVVLEAMASGLPVVATRCEGTTEAILHRQTGFLVEPKSVSQMADALEEVFTGGTDYAAMSQAARARHADQFSDTAMARSVAGVYDGMLKNRG